MMDAGVNPPVPPNPLPYLTEWLFEIGPTEPAGMGAAPIAWQTLAIWSELTGAELLPWEARLLRNLSREYLNEAHQAEKRDRPAPWSEHIDREAISSKVSSLFRSRLLERKKDADE